MSGVFECRCLPSTPYGLLWFSKLAAARRKSSYGLTLHDMGYESLEGLVERSYQDNIWIICFERHDLRVHNNEGYFSERVVLLHFASGFRVHGRSQ